MWVDGHLHHNHKNNSGETNNASHQPWSGALTSSSAAWTSTAKRHIRWSRNVVFMVVVTSFYGGRWWDEITRWGRGGELHDLVHSCLSLHVSWDLTSYSRRVFCITETDLHGWYWIELEGRAGQSSQFSVTSIEIVENCRSRRVPFCPSCPALLFGGIEHSKKDRGDIVVIDVRRPQITKS